jgi:uncharacterized iron-regulated membrane protein
MSIHPYIQRAILVVVLLALGLTGCGWSGAAPAETGETKTAEPVLKEAAAGSVAALPAEAEYSPVDESAPAPLATAAPAMAADSAARSEDSAPAAEVSIQQQAESLRAGEVNDNRQWDDYLLYRRNYTGPAITRGISASVTSSP